MAPMMESRRLFDASWTETYRALDALCQDSESRPDFIVADFFAEDAARDVLHRSGIQIAVVHPQMPYFLAPASYVPGVPGFQVDVSLTSEHASLISRFRNEMVVVKSLPDLLSWIRWKSRMRRDAGVFSKLPMLTKPNYLVLVNSFFGLETPKDLPPLMAPIGPILSDTYAPLENPLLEFLDSRKHIIYISFGTHVCLPAEDLDKIICAMIKCIAGGHLDGVVWSLAARPRASLETLRSAYLSHGTSDPRIAILDNTNPHFHITNFAPQRAVLEHPHTRIFVTHGGGSSANETVFHGVPVVAIGYFFDQLCNAVRLRDAGVGVCLDKTTFTAQDLYDAVVALTADVSGSFARNVRRMQRIAHVASRRKQLGADLIEEVMYDQELRLDDVGSSAPRDRSAPELRPMHLQTADARMSIWKAKNLDMWLVGLTSAVIGTAVGWYMLRRGLRFLPQSVGYAYASGTGLATYLLHNGLGTMGGRRFPASEQW
jgi:UDP:flavonoid glycosyltransferase YjiC (YdhE family)